jgi:hypothetical protein
MGGPVSDYMLGNGNGTFQAMTGQTALYRVADCVNRRSQFPLSIR